MLRDVLCGGACKVRAQQFVPEVCRGAASGQEKAGSSLDGVWGSPQIPLECLCAATELERADLSWAHCIVFSGSNISAKTIVQRLLDTVSLALQSLVLWRPLLCGNCWPQP